eukprot:TRINITY_DN4811_c0_g1_i1.p2 TRINITY_DN4811_c0_g1~~TRINITY_DN4811_c0_g1_i1.p2  ORF type:complete len:158 (-),score=3.92 TRINITY_DN4811_c0_g1_i1:103-576(-)
MGAGSRSAQISLNRGTGSQAQQFVTVLQRDGKVLQFSRRLRCSQLVAANPGHTVYLVSGVVQEEEGMLVPRETFLELGQVYLLVPHPGSDCSSSSLPFRITKDYVAKILAARAPTAPQISRRSESSARRPRTPPAIRRARSGHWVSSLCSIPEVGAV